MVIEIDFETYSEAGYEYTDGKWRSIVKNKSGIAAVGADVYTEHPSARVLCMAYGDSMWLPCMPPPQRLFDYIASGGVVEAHNARFEYLVWNNVCVYKYGWPPLPLESLRCSMAKARGFGLPGSLDAGTKALELSELKDPRGKYLLNRVSIPTGKPVKPEDYEATVKYCAQDVTAERALSAACPDLSPTEREIYLVDQKINNRGVAVDRAGLADCLNILQQAETQYTAELADITAGEITSVGEIARMVRWVVGKGIAVHNLDEESVTATLTRKDLPPAVRRVLEIRSILGASSVKKLYAINRMMSHDGRLRGLFAYYGAERTGRFAGRGPQPQNLPRQGPAPMLCRQCGKYCAVGPVCRRCGGAGVNTSVEWNVDCAEQALVDMSPRSLAYVESLWGNAVQAISGSLRALFVAAPGHELICSDFSAIEAVVLAMLSGEQWRIDAFRTHGKIYEACLSRITGIPFEEILEYKKTHGVHHPLRKQFGKIPELASGYQGWIGAWKQFGADEYMTDEEIKNAILKWRADSPMIAGIKQYGEIVQHGIWSGLEYAARYAIETPGQWMTYRDISYGVWNDVLWCKLPSGRYLCYHKPRLDPLSYMGNNSNFKKGKMGWTRIELYGGMLTENVVQAVARDIFTTALVNLDKAGYPIVLHTHDEIAAEIPEGTGDIPHFEKIMSTGHSDWPIRAAGGWIGKRYRKE